MELVGSWDGSLRIKMEVGVREVDDDTGGSEEILPLLKERKTETLRDFREQMGKIEYEKIAIEVLRDYCLVELIF